MVSYKIEIETKTIIKIIAVPLVIFLLFQIRDILMQVFISIILMTALNPLVNRLQRIKIFNKSIPRVTAVVSTYLLLILVITIFLLIVVQPLTEQTSKFVGQIPGLLSFLNREYNINLAFISQQSSQLGTISSNLVTFISGVFTNLFAIFTTSVLSFYLLLEREQLHHYLAVLMRNNRSEKRVEFFLNRLEWEMGGWVRAQLLLMVIIGLLSYMGFAIMGIPYAIPLALIAGGLEIVPNIGPILAAVPAGIAGFSLGIRFGILVLGWSWIVQLLENNLIVPQIMERNTGLNPLVTIVVLLIGYALAGISGAILGVPAIIIARAVFEEFFAQSSQS